jgi:hypothetical protein
VIRVIFVLHCVQSPLEPGGLRRLVNLKGWAARQHP